MEVKKDKMILQKNKKGKIGMNFVNTVVLTIILITVLFQVYAEVIPEAQTASSGMNDSQICVAASCAYNASYGCQYNSTFQGNATFQCSIQGSDSFIPLSGTLGVTYVIIMAALLVLIVKSSMGTK